MTLDVYCELQSNEKTESNAPNESGASEDPGHISWVVRGDFTSRLAGNEVCAAWLDIALSVEAAVGYVDHLVLIVGVERDCKEFRRINSL